MKNYHCLNFLLPLLLILLVGCGSNVTTTGTITFPDGTPLTEGMIIFQDDLNEFNSNIRRDGTYSMWGIREGDGIPPGAYSVSFRFPNYMFAESAPVSAKFLDPDASGLAAEVSAGKRNVFNFTVEPNPIPPASRREYVEPQGLGGR